MNPYRKASNAELRRVLSAGPGAFWDTGALTEVVRRAILISHAPDAVTRRVFTAVEAAKKDLRGQDSRHDDY